MGGVVALLYFADGRVVNLLQGELRGIIDGRDSADEERVGHASENSLRSHARVRLGVHEWFHADRDLVRASPQELESSRFGDPGDFSHTTTLLEDPLEVAEVAQSGGVNGHRLVGIGESLRLIVPGENVEVLAPYGEPVTRENDGQRTCKQKGDEACEGKTSISSVNFIMKEKRTMRCVRTRDLTGPKSISCRKKKTRKARPEQTNKTENHKRGVCQD